MEIRVFSENPAEDVVIALPDRPQANHEFIQPLFVSRAPTRKMTGQGHKETIRSAKPLKTGFILSKISLSELTLDSLKNMVNPERDKDLYNDLMKRLLEYGNDPKKAFEEPFYKKGGVLVKSIKVKIPDTKEINKLKSGINVRGGIATNPEMVRVDVFIKGGKYFLVPIYTWQVAKGILPNRAVIKSKCEAEWEEMDENAVFQFALYPNDLVEVVTKKEKFFGYYVNLDRSDGRIKLREHDLDKQKGEEGEYRLGTKTAISIQKYQVDELGKNIRPCRPMKKRPPVR